MSNVGLERIRRCHEIGGGVPDFVFFSLELGAAFLDLVADGLVVLSVLDLMVLRAVMDNFASFTQGELGACDTTAGTPMLQRPSGAFEVNFSGAPACLVLHFDQFSCDCSVSSVVFHQLNRELAMSN
jgi:hypothetical protein